MHEDQFEQVMTVVRRAYEKDESNSMLLLSRAPQVVHSFLSQIESEVDRELAQAE